jgi:hypothetical protein
VVPGGKRDVLAIAAPLPDRPAATWLLAALALVLPFETPLFRAGPLLITSVELALYLTLGAWAFRLARDGLGNGPRAIVRRAVAGADPLAWAAVVWLLVVVLSAVAAPSLRAPAGKFALRTAAGVLLFFASRDLARAPGAARRVALAIAVGALLSAALGLVDSALPDEPWLWKPFRPDRFSMLGLPRPAGPFAYPTMAAMYWEAALPLLVLFADRRARSRGAVAAIAGAGVLVAAILASATRTALVGAAVGSGALLILGWPLGKNVRLAAGGALALTGLFVGLALLADGSQSLLTQRLHWWRDDRWFGARYTVDPAPLTLPPGAQIGIDVTVQNTGVLTWPHQGADAVHLSYHWESHDADGAHLHFEGRRTPLPDDVQPGASVALVGRVDVPRKPGRYRLRWDLVRESVTWFSERGIPTADQTVDVVGDARAKAGAHGFTMLSSTLEDWVAAALPNRPELWRAAVRLFRQHPLLGVGPDNFRRRYAEVIAPKSGKKYDDDRLHANSFYLETLADLGLVGLAALVFLLVALGRAVLAHARARRLPLLACGIAAGLFFVHGLLDYFLEFTPLYGLFWLTLGLTASRTTEA